MIGPAIATRYSPVICRQLKAVLVLPGGVLVLVPALIIWSTSNTDAAARYIGPANPGFWLGAIFGAIGLGFAIWTVRLFITRGEGTLAPWDPPQQLVILGPYRHVRNPMISSVYMMLLAESLMLNAWIIAVWLSVFFLVNEIYIPCSEEKALEARFGETYLRYKTNVPCWLPNPFPWDPDNSGENA